MTVANTGTGQTYKVVTNGDGHYAVPFLTSGMYRVMTMREGFAPAVREGVRLEAQQVARVDLMLVLGAVSETMEVADGRIPVESTVSRMDQVIENRVVAGMPSNGRNYPELAPLAGEALPATVMGVGARTGATGGFTAMGSQAYQTTISVDAVDNTPIPTGGAQGQVAQATTPSLDSLNEFRVVTNNYSAEHGFRIGPQVFVSLKSGTNRFRGSLHEYFDEGAFVAAAPGVYGNTGRNLLEGLGSLQLDALLARRFRMPWEGHWLQFRAEAFNATNTARFGQPNGMLRTPSTAAISTANHARRLQFALRYEF